MTAIEMDREIFVSDVDADVVFGPAQKTWFMAKLLPRRKAMSECVECVESVLKDIELHRDQDASKTMKMMLVYLI